MPLSLYLMPLSLCVSLHSITITKNLRVDSFPFKWHCRFVQQTTRKIAVFTFVSFRFIVYLFPIEMDAVASWNQIHQRNLFLSRCHHRMNVPTKNRAQSTKNVHCVHRRVHCVFVLACTLIARFWHDAQMQSSLNLAKVCKTKTASSLRANETTHGYRHHQINAVHVCEFFFLLSF